MNSKNFVLSIIMYRTNGVSTRAYRFSSLSYIEIKDVCKQSIDIIRSNIFLRLYKNDSYMSIIRYDIRRRFVNVCRTISVGRTTTTIADTVVVPMLFCLRTWCTIYWDWCNCNTILWQWSLYNVVHLFL